MPKILIGECKQETSSFNPQPTHYHDFVVRFGAAILDHHRKVRNEIGQVPIQDENFWQQCRRAIWDYGDFEPERDKVGNKLKEFRQGMEILCRPVVDLYKR